MWYKNLSSKEDYIGKYRDGITNNHGNFNATAYIWKENFHTINGGLTSDFSNAIECSLEEIQPYLPEGHPDKYFVLPENFYVKVTEENQPVLAKWLEMSQPHYLTSAHIAGITFKNNGFAKGYNPADKIKDSDPEGYDFGKEITYEQFKKYVLNQKPVKEDYSYLIKVFKKWNIK